jgi:hypothetical protein
MNRKRVVIGSFFIAGLAALLVVGLGNMAMARPVPVCQPVAPTPLPPVCQPAVTTPPPAACEPAKQDLSLHVLHHRILVALKRVHYALDHRVVESVPVCKPVTAAPPVPVCQPVVAIPPVPVCQPVVAVPPPQVCEPVRPCDPVQRTSRHLISHHLANLFFPGGRQTVYVDPAAQPAPAPTPTSAAPLPPPAPPKALPAPPPKA